MDLEMVIVVVLSGGILALLVWFEVNSRRHEAGKEHASSPAHPHSPSGAKAHTNQAESENDKTKAA
jgi:hypothetical protein